MESRGSRTICGEHRHLQGASIATILCFLGEDMLTSIYLWQRPKEVGAALGWGEEARGRNKERSPGRYHSIFCTGLLRSLSLLASPVVPGLPQSKKN